MAGGQQYEGVPSSQALDEQEPSLSGTDVPQQLPLKRRGVMQRVFVSAAALALLCGAVLVGVTRRPPGALSAVGKATVAYASPPAAPFPVSGLPLPGNFKFKNKPRVRREWRTLSTEKRQRVAAAFWTLKETSTKEGRARYGPYFQNYDELLMLHTCAVTDPRCDQGHLGPHFISFHRMLLLKLEMALLAVDPKIEAMPYWNQALDAVNGTYRHDSEKYIFTDKYFGSFFGNKNKNYTVDNGLFANWPIAKWTSEQFGAGSELAEESRCIRLELFKGTKADTCDRCCGKSQCKCGEQDTYSSWLRAHKDCTPHSARQPDDPTSPNAAKLGGSYEIVYGQTDFDACHKFPENVRSWMDWQNCIDPGFVFCTRSSQELANNTRLVAQLKGRVLPQMLKEARVVLKRRLTLPSGVSGEMLEHAQKLAALATATLFNLQRQQVPEAIAGLCEASPMIYGYYKATGKLFRDFPNFAHGNAHFKFGRDFYDITTSPNDPGAFSGQHADVDRSNMHLMLESLLKDSSMESRYWDYPRTQSDLTGKEGLPPYALGGPFGVGSMLECQNFSDYTYYRYGAMPWTPGTLLGDVVNAGYSFKDVFNSSCPLGEDCSGRTTNGYRHRDVLYYTSPYRTPYTYDTLEHYFDYQS